MKIKPLPAVGALGVVALGTLAVNIGAVFLAHAIAGPTFWVPPAAAVANVAFGAGMPVEVCR